VTSEGFGHGLSVRLAMASLIPLSGWSSGFGGVPASANGSASNDCPLGVTVDTLTNFTYNDPVVSGVSPSHGPSVGGTVVNVTGSGFGSSTAGGPPRVLLLSTGSGGPAVDVSLSVVAYGHGWVTAVMAASVGANQSIAVVHGSTGVRAVLTNAWSFDAPVVTGAWVGALDTPGGGLQTEGGSTVVVSGVNFGPAGSGARVYVAGVGVSSFVVVNDSSAQFVGVAGFGANHSVVVEVGGQVSNSDVAVSYALPTVQSVSVLPGSTAASKLLEVSGVNMGRSCVGCLPVGQQPSLCAAGACNSSASVCGGGSSPVVTVWSVPDMVGYPCDVLCVSPASSTVTSITCRTAFPFRTGAVSVNVSGLVSATVGVDYDELLSEPEVHSASPSACGSVGCNVTLSGVNLASTEVLVSNALSAWVVSTLSNNGTSISFSLGAGQGMVSVGVRVIGTSVVSNVIQYWYTAGVVSSVSPLSGGTSGGVVVIVNGTNLGSALAVTTPLGCNAVNRVWIGPWVCTVVEVSVAGVCVCAFWM
jgi:hypothetical protein